MVTKTCTVVFTDLANYQTSASRTDREALRNLVAVHEQMVAPVIERYGGEVIKTHGDSFLALFTAATDAVRAGLALIESISGEDGYHIRVGMATGDVEVIAGDAFGEVVNLSSRILSKTPVGQVWLSQATLLCMNQAEIAWESVGRYALKGIAGETEIQRAVPHHRAWLPEPVLQAIRAGRLVRFQRDTPPEKLPPNPIVLLEGYPPGSQVLEDTVASLPVIDPASLWLVTYTIAPSDRIDWERAGRGLIIATPDGLNAAIQEARQRIAYTTGSDTIILDSQSNATVELVLAGLALPEVPMSEVVAGYTYDLLADGRWVNNSGHAVARLDVSPRQVSLMALVTGLRIGDRQMIQGQSVALVNNVQIITPSGALRFIQQPDGPYAGFLLGDSHIRMGIAPGQQAEIGREPNHPGLALPDRRGQDNIRWCPGVRAARARNSGFTMDRALAGRRQAAVGLSTEGISLMNLHEHCPTFVYEGGTLSKIDASRHVQTGDLIVTGTSVIALREPTN